MEKYSAEFLMSLYHKMLQIRMCEERFVRPILNNEIGCPVHLCSGQEAVAVGACSALTREDCIFGGHRSHGHYLAKGGSLKELVAEIYGKQTGCSRGRGGSMHLIAPEIGMLGSAPIVSGTIALAVGAALGYQIRKTRNIAVSFFGDGATGEGVLYESLNFAALKKLPVIFVCENNLYSTHMPIHKCRPEEAIHKIALPFNITSFCVEGNDVLKVYEAAQQAADMCRRNEGPVFIECRTYRLRGHVGPDDNIQGIHTDIRPGKELDEWKKKDAIQMFEKWLLDRQIIDLQQKDRIYKEIEEQIDDAFLFAADSPYPDEKEVTEYVFK